MKKIVIEFDYKDDGNIDYSVECAKGVDAGDLYSALFIIASDAENVAGNINDKMPTLYKVQYKDGRLDVVKEDK